MAEMEPIKIEIDASQANEAFDILQGKADRLVATLKEANALMTGASTQTVVHSVEFSVHGSDLRAALELLPRLGRVRGNGSDDTPEVPA